MYEEYKVNRDTL